MQPKRQLIKQTKVIFGFSTIKLAKNHVKLINIKNHVDQSSDSSNDQESDLFAASDSKVYKSYGLTDKELQVLKNIFGYKNPEGLRQV